MRRRVARRRVYRRRRRNPGFRTGGIPIPNFGAVLTGVAGGVGAKVLGRTVFPQGASMFGGWGGPLTTLGAGIALAFVARMLKQGRFASPIVTGAATIAALDALKLTPIGAQLGVYSAPSGMTPVLNGVGAGIGFPAGFANPSLAYGNTQDPFEFAP